MDYSKLQNGSDIRGVALEGVEGQHINLTEQACRDIGRGFALWLTEKNGKKEGLRVAASTYKAAAPAQTGSSNISTSPGATFRRPMRPRIA